MEARKTSGRRILIIMLVGAVLGVLVWFAPAFFSEEKKVSQPALKIGGTSNVYVVMDNRWRGAYGKKKGIAIEYESAGSTKGIQQMIEGEIAIAFTHSPMSEEQKKQAQAKRGAVIHIPVILCAVVPAYNVKELNDKPPLNFTADVLSDIFLGKIERWDNAALKKLNPAIDLPDTPIQVAHRSDSSGTTLIFAEYLYGASPAWQKAMGKPANDLKWPVGKGLSRSGVVARHVERTDGTIGYMDLVHAMGQLAYGAVQNKDQTAFIHATADHVVAAAKKLLPSIPDDLTFNLTNQPGTDSYPISSGIWAVCYQEQPAAQHKLIADFLHWIVQEGQQCGEGFAPLPSELVERAERKINSLKVK